MKLILSYDDLVDLTHYKRPCDQIRALNQMGIDYKVRPDGTPAVLRSTLEGREDTKPGKLNLDAA